MLHNGDDSMNRMKLRWSIIFDDHIDVQTKEEEKINVLGESVRSVLQIGKEFFPKYIPEVSISNSQLDGTLTKIVYIQNQNFFLYLKF